MRITSRPIDVPLSAPFRIATGEVTSANNVLVEVAERGLVGVGESTPFRVVTGADQAAVILDLDSLPGDARVPSDDPAEVLASLPHGDLTRDARQALDVAVHDWAAQHRRVPLFRLLGGNRRDLPTSITVPIVPLANIAPLVHDALEKGFRILKVKSRSGVDEERQRIRLIRDLAGSGVEIRVDANAGWSRTEAHQMLPALRRANVVFLEQPLDRTDLAGLAELVRTRSVPIMVDESVFTLADAERVMEAKAADLINVKLAKTGGILEAARILRFAEAQGIPCMVGCMIQTRIASSADAHVAAAFPIVKHVDIDGHTFLAQDPVRGGVTIHRGVLRIPETPGHGARLAPVALAR